MVRIRTIALVLAAAALAAVYFSPGPAAQEPPPASAAELVLGATVVRIIDGDGIAVKLDSGPMDIRLHGIDAPEQKQPYGREAKAAMEGRVRKGDAVELHPIEQDKYDRMVAVVYANGASVNEALIRDGFAWAYRDYLGQLDGDGHYCEFEAQARSARRGLWSQPTELWVPPWIYRRRQDAPPGAKLPSKDYSAETAGECVAAIKQSRPAPLLQPLLQDPSQANCQIKGNINSKGDKIYHVPGDANYEATRIDTARGERWFCTEEEARAAGWRAVR